MHNVSTNFAKSLAWKHEYDVKLWRHKHPIPNTNNHHMPLNDPPWIFSAYATDRWCYFFNRRYETLFANWNTLERNAGRNATWGKECRQECKPDSTPDVGGLVTFSRTTISFFWASCWNHCLAALDLGTGVEQLFNCLIVQHRQAMQSMRRSMEWRTTWATVCSSAPHSQVAEEAIPHFYKQKRKRPTPVRRRLSRTQALLVRDIPGWVGAGVGDENAESCGAVRPLSDPPIALHVCCCCQMNWWDVVRRVQMGVSIWGAVCVHSMDGWALSGADVQAPEHSVLETVWLHCDEAQQIGCLRGLEGCPLV